MESFFLIKPGEILLKRDNQKEFTQRLIRQIRNRMGTAPCSITEFPGRFFLSTDAVHEEKAVFVLSHCPGLNGFAKAFHGQKTVAAILGYVLETAKQGIGRGYRTFKIETRRSDKSFPLGSYEMSAKAGEYVLASCGELSVDVHNPDLVITIEIRERAYVYGKADSGVRGLPSGSSAKGLLLLSGGIDSPVAGYMMAKRGMALECVYFHAYPYTSNEAKEKVERLAKRLTAWAGALRLWVVPFTDVQLHIKKHAPADSNTIMLRMAMMEAAQRIASRSRASAIITGESLGQVASQTVENMRVTGSPSSLPLFRPLVGMDKEDTIERAKKIGTFDISILPYEDCCVLFSPRHPVLRPDFDEQTGVYASLGLTPLIEKAVEESERLRYGYADALEEFGLGGQ